MKPRPNELRVRRLLVALDASAHGLAGLEAAVRLARRAQSELVGLFVEDSALLRLAALPVARLVRSAGEGARELDVGQMERELRARSSRAEGALRRTAERAELRFSFRVVRGEVASEVVAASGGVDVVVLPITGAPLARPEVAAETARRVVAEAGSSVLLVRQGHALGGPTVVYDGEPGSDRALAAAAYLALHDGGVVTVLAVSDTFEGARALAESAARELVSQGIEVRARPLLQSALADALGGLRDTAGGALVLTPQALPVGISLAGLVARSRRPIMITH